MFKGVKPIRYGNREVLPLIEGGKGVSATNGASSGAWAAAGGIGTASAAHADSHDPEGPARVGGGEGVSAPNGASSGAWAAAGGIGTVSAVNADSYDPEGKIVPQVYRALTRRDRHEEPVHYAIDR